MTDQNEPARPSRSRPTATPRDETELILRRWDVYERARGATPILDFDFRPAAGEVVPVASRLEALTLLEGIRSRLDPDRDRAVLVRLTADVAYLRALLGQRDDLDTYLLQTQGCPATGWPEDYVTAVGERARQHVADLGLPWDSSTMERQAAMEGRLTVEAATEAIRAAATEFEPTVRALVGSDAPFELSIETVEVDAYWAYWLDGVASRARLRFNLRRAAFTTVAARQFALHEILGHALQGASLAQRAAQEEVPWVRLLSVHAPQQVLFEGLAQALPLFVAPDDAHLVARVRLAHFTQLARAELHVAVNNGASIDDCVGLARRRVPFWTDADIADALTDRATNPLLRSYLWAYPAGIDWFVHLADDDPEQQREILTAAYRDPLTPLDLQNLWPDGPTVGGSHVRTPSE